MNDDLMPEPEPAGALVPPPRNPPTALASAATPLLPSRPSRVITPREDFFRGIVRSTLDALDDAGDSIARAIGLR